MSLFNLSKTVFEVLNSAQSLNEAKVIREFPNVNKPSRLGGTVVAVGQELFSSSAASIGCGEQTATASVKVGIYSPLKLGLTELSNTAKSVVKAVLQLSPSEISLSPSEGDEALGCLKCSCTFTFNIYLESEIEEA